LEKGDGAVYHKGVSLALGSGGLRGLSHIGVLKVLEQESIPVNMIAGCSIGSLIGALYAAGLKPEEMEKLAKNLHRRHWIDFIVPKNGLVAGQRVLEMMRLLTKNKNFDELDISLAIVATDLYRGQEIIFDKGSVAEAVRASISVPGIFVPYSTNGTCYVDGAVVNPTPIDVARKRGAGIVVAVDLANTGTICNVTNVFDIILMSVDIMERELIKHRLIHSDILIQPKVGHILPSDFCKVNELIALGEEAAREALPEIKTLLKAEKRRE
jgi:NTE family protein